MGRPKDWWVLDLHGDPTPGSAERAEALGHRLHSFADVAEDAHRSVTSMQGDDAVLAWVGQSGDAFRHHFGEFPAQVEKVYRSHRMAAEALVNFAPQLRESQVSADRALADGREARAKLHAAAASLHTAEGSAHSSDSHADTLKADTKADPQQVEQAVRDAQAAKQQLANAKGEVASAQQALDAAKNLADQAAGLHRTASTACEKALHAASDAGIPPRSFWAQLKEGFGKVWHVICEVAKWVAIVAGVIAMILGGPAAWVALLAGLVVLVGAIVDYAHGKGSVTDLVFGILGVIPGVKGLTTLTKLKDLYKAGGLAGIGKATLTGMKDLAISMANLVKNMGQGILTIVKTGIANIVAKFNELPSLTSKANLEIKGCADPIDISTGRMFHTEQDIALPGALPLVLTRSHRSDFRLGRSFGPTWASTLDQRVQVEPGGVHLVREDGSLLSYPEPDAVGPVFPVEGSALPLRRSAEGGFVVADRRAGRRLLFASPDGEGAALLSAVECAGDRIDIVRDGAGTPLELRHSAGYRLALDSADGLVTAISLLPAVGEPVRLRAFRYDEAQRLVGVVNDSGAAMTFEYDADGRVTRWVDRNGHWYAYTYDELGRCVRTDGAGGYLSYRFSYDGPVTRATDSLGHTWTYQLNDRLQVVAETDPLGNTAHFEWDERHRPLAHTDPLGATSRLAYDAQGRLTAVTSPDGGRVTVAYTARGDVGEVVDAAGRSRRWQFDGAGQLTSMTDATGALLEFEAAPDEPGIVRDDFGRVVADATHRYAWTPGGKLLERAGPEGHTEPLAYDSEENPVVRDGRRIEYGPFDLPIADTDATGARTEFTWDTELRLTSVVNPLGEIWSYAYDGAGRLTSQTDFAGFTTHYRHDAAGRLVWVDAGGTVTEYTYDVLGDLVEQRVDGAVSRFEWDGGLLVRASNGAADVVLERDANGRVVAETVNGATVESAYDPAGRRVSLRTPSGEECRWAYDAVGRPETMTAAGEALLFTRDAAGREHARQLGETALLTSEFDAAGRLVTQSVIGLAGRELLAHRDVLRSPAGDVLAVADDRGFRAYELDAAGRVLQVRADTHTERYAYDDAGNLLGQAGGAHPQAHAQDHGRDHAGRLTARTTDAGQWLHTWDGENRMTGASTPDGTRWRYRYDALGRRTAKERLTADGAVAERVEFSWLGFQLLEQRGPDGTVTWFSHPETGHVVAQVADGAFAAVVTDEIGTPTELVSPSGEITWRRAATLWGTDASTEMLLRFPGQYFDAETGLHYNVQRYYDPQTARYASPDPLGLLPAPNPLAYVPNPLVTADPLGLWHCTEYNGLFPRNNYVDHVAPHAETQNFSRAGLRESEHVMPMAAINRSGIPTLGENHEITISIPYNAHQGAKYGNGGGISSTGSSTTATSWSNKLANLLRTGQNIDAYRLAIMDQLNTSIHSAGALCHYLDELRMMDRPAGAGDRLTEAEVKSLQNEIFAIYWQRMTPPIGNLTPAESNFVDLARSGLTKTELAAHLNLTIGQVNEKLFKLLPDVAPTWREHPQHIPTVNR